MGVRRNREGDKYAGKIFRSGLVTGPDKKGKKWSGRSGYEVLVARNA